MMRLVPCRKKLSTRFPLATGMLLSAGESDSKESKTLASPHLEYRRWPAMLTVACGIGLTLIVWQATRSAESTHIRTMTRLAASAVREDFASDTESWTFGLIRLARLWESPNGPSHAEWQSHAEIYIRHHPGCTAVEWLQPSFEESWIVHAPGESTAALDLNGVPGELLNRARQQRLPLMGKAERTDNGAIHRLIVVPIFQGQNFEGFVIALTDVPRSYSAMMADVSTIGYYISVTEEGREIFRLPGSTAENEKEWSQYHDVPLPGVSVRIAVWPTHEVLGEMRSSLPQTVLLLGGALCLVLAVTVNLAQKAASRSTHLQHANKKLLTAIDEQHRIEAALRSSQMRLSGILEISADAVISVDEQMCITMFNQGAEKMFGYSQQEVIGQPLNILVPERLRSIHSQHMQMFASSDQQTLLMSQRRPVFALRKDGSEFPMDASLAKLRLAEGTVFTAIVRDVTERVRAQEDLHRSHEELEQRVKERTAELQKLSNRLVQFQDEERRRIARELHDGTTQTLIALSMDIGALNKFLTKAEPRVQQKLEEAKELVAQSINEIRTVSYLLHPPLLDELGLDSAMRNYVEGFSRRSGIDVDLILPDLGALPRDAELAIFRVVQECLTNIHRHSGSPTASITLRRDNGEVSLSIADQGCGIPPQVLDNQNGSGNRGVGLAGMRERIRQLDGQCEIQSNSRGTLIRILLPVQKPANSRTA
jgi:PAS domain S-box-containing protein